MRKLASQTAIYGLSTIVGRFLNYLMVPLYTEVLKNTSDYGVVNQLFAYTGFLMVLYSYRMESAFFRFGTPEADRARAYTTGLGAMIGSSLVFSVLLLLCSEGIADALRLSDHPEYVRYFALILGLDALCELPFARLRLEQRPKRFVGIKLTNIGINIGLNLFWLVFCPWADAQGMDWVRWVWQPDVQVGYIFLANVVASGVTLLLLLPEFRLQGGFFDRVLLGKMLWYAAPLIVVSMAGVVNEMLDRAILIYLLPGDLEWNRSQLGIYGANYKLAMLITLFTQAYRYAAEPFFFRTANSEQSPQIIADAAKWFTLASSVAMLGVLLFLPELKYFLRKPEYHDGLGVVPILVLANVLLGVYFNVSVWFRIKDKTALGAGIALAGAAITVVLNLLLIPVMGYYGSAWATLACYAFTCVVTWYVGQRHYPVPYPIGRMALYIGLALAVYGVMRFYLPNLGENGMFGWRVCLFLGYVGFLGLLEMKNKII
jgi:O-antigen/teichoic acid export membrane protein